MLKVISTSFINFNQQVFQKKVKPQQSLTNPIYGLQYRYNLSSDEICFKSRPVVNIEKARELIINNSKRKTIYVNIGKSEVDSILKFVTERSYPLLEKILNLGQRALSAVGVATLLKHANNENTNLEEFEEKLDNFDNLKNWVTEKGFSESPLAEHIDRIPSKSIVKLLESDLLLRKNKSNFKPFKDAYNYTVGRFAHDQRKLQTTEENIPKKAIEFMTKNFVNVVLLAMVFNKDACNELLYNRSEYVESVYIPRLKALNTEDLTLLRKVQDSSKTSTINKKKNITSPISLDDKIYMLNLLSANREIINAGFEGVDFEKYITEGEKKDSQIIDLYGLKIDLADKALRRIGIPNDFVDRYTASYMQTIGKPASLTDSRDKFWDINYAHLLNAPEGSFLNQIIVAATLGNFDKMIYEEGKIAETNNRNREAFEKNGIEYDRWLNPTIAPITVDFYDPATSKTKKFTVQNWERCPQKSLMDGNYTTCCTGIDKDHGPSFLHFITNTCSTTLEVRTEKDKVFAMTRLMLAKVNNKLSLIVENIEANNKMVKHYLRDDESKIKFREMIFDYVRNFAKDINKNAGDLPIYFCSHHFKIEGIQNGLKPGIKYNDVELIGEFPNNLYINAYGGRFDKYVIRDDGDDFFLFLTDISKK